eukprot:scaffold6655_cov169-Amphora_coffeaeformis.AAC.2
MTESMSTMSTMDAMLLQESKYIATDYLHQASPQRPTANAPLHAVDVDCRSKMVSWCFQVVDFCKFQRETASIAINYLDRYMTTPASALAHTDRKTFQLFAMTCLYTAVKIHEPEAMDPKLVSTLSRGTYTPQEVEAAEAQILGALEWRMNPPTALSFVRMFLDILPAGFLTSAQQETAYELSKFQTELAVNEYDFLSVRPSVVAYSALVNALESISLDEKLMGRISDGLAESVKINTQADKIFEVQNWLYQAVSTQPGNVVQQPKAAAPSQAKFSRRSSFEVSPRSILYICYTTYNIRCLQSVVVRAHVGRPAEGRSRDPARTSAGKTRSPWEKLPNYQEQRL